MLVFLLAACSSSHNSGSAEDGPQGIEGIWTGSRTKTVYRCVLFACAPHHTETTPAIALAAADGRIHLFAENSYSSIAGTARVSRRKVSGQLNHICDPLDGPPILGHVDIDGSFASGKTLDISYEFDECIGDGVFNLVFDAASLQAPSLDRITGIWSSQQVSITVDPDGSYLGADDTGCQLSGSVVPGSSTVNIFDISMLIENCPAIDGQYAGLAAVILHEPNPEILMMGGMGSDAIFWLGLQR